jgi:hypothetical protein
MNRREFLGTMAIAPLAARGLQAVASRTFEVVTRIELEESHDAGIAWVPLPLTRTSPFQIDRGHTVGGNADKTRVERLAESGATMLVAEWGHMMPPPAVTVTMRIETMDYSVDLNSPGRGQSTIGLSTTRRATPRSGAAGWAIFAACSR